MQRRKIVHTNPIFESSVCQEMSISGNGIRAVTAREEIDKIGNMSK